jgi:hypothetical protein
VIYFRSGNASFKLDFSSGRGVDTINLFCNWNNIDGAGNNKKY